MSDEIKHLCDENSDIFESNVQHYTLYNLEWEHG